MNTTNSSSRPFSLGLYLLIVFGLSWPFQAASVLWATDALSGSLLNSASMVMVAVGTVIAGRYVFRDGFANAGWRWGKLKHYLAVVGLVVLLWVFPTLIRFALGTLGLSDVDRTQMVWLCVSPLATLIPGFGEEFGWRGYMLPHLARRLSARRAVVIHAVIWWAWHLPVSVGAGVQAGVAGAGEAGLPISLSIVAPVLTVVIVGAIPTILHGVVFAYIWVRSRSLAVATVYHAGFDGVRDSLGMVVGLPFMVGLWGIVVLTMLGIIFLWKGKTWTSNGLG
ncbi:MAG: CPBP family intramembrane glutamic endopeptidase [Chloroflexota bacterium]